MVDSLRLNLIKLLTDWLEKKHKHTKPPTVETLEAALSSCTVGLGNVADDVRRYITLVPHDIDLESSPPYLEIHIDLSIDRPYDELTDYDYDCIEPCDNGNTNFRTTCSTNMPSSSLYVEENRPVLLEINAISGIDGSLNYQWLRGDQVLNNNNDYSGTTGPLLCITKAEIEMDGHEFSCRITTSGLQQAIVTTPVTLKVKCPLDEYRDSLDSMYLAKPEVPEDTWPPACNEKYINLALVKQEQINFGTEYARVTIRGDIDDVLQHKEMIQFEAIIKELTSGQVLFIEGRPGSGKTTFVHKITQSWATLSNGALRLILLVSLRVLNNLNKRKLDLSDILQLFRDLKVSKRLVEERDGKGVCFIFDGLDEFSPRDGKKSLVYKIINKEYLHQSIVIVASRPAAITKLKRRADKVIETLGFQRRQIFEYFDHFPFSSYSKANELKKYVSCHQNVLHMCYLPIHAAMVSFLFEITGKVPQTETEIYTHFTHFTLVRSFSKNREIDLSDIDVTNLSGEEEILFNQICKLALEKTVLNKQVLQQDEVSSYFKIKKGEDISLGLINIDCTAGLYGFNNLYTFPKSI